MSDIVGFEACARELRKLLSEVTDNINAAGKKGSDALHDAVLAETKRLVDFTNRTEPADILNGAEIANIRKIDQSADDARREIFGNSADVIIGRIQDRISQLNQLEKAVRQEATANQQEAKKIRLVPLRNAVDAVTETIKAVKNAKEALSDDDPDEAAVKAKIESVLRAIAALENSAVGLLGPS